MPSLSLAVKAKVVALSTWCHIQCPECEEWFAVEDGKKVEYYCAHCGELLNITEVKNG